MPNEVFLDTAYLIALSSPDDELHVRAISLRRQMKTLRRRLVTTRAILLEIGNALARVRFRQEGVKLLETNGASLRGQITHEFPHREAKMTRLAAFSPHLAAGADKLRTGFMPKWGELLIFRLFLPLQWEESSILN